MDYAYQSQIDTTTKQRIDCTTHAHYSSAIVSHCDIDS